MNSIKRILLATDFSKSNQYALKRAAELAKINKGVLSILHVFSESWVERAAQWFSKKKHSQYLHFKREANQIYNQKIKPKLAHLKTNFTIKLGREDETIIQFAKDKKSELLVIGAHGNYHFHEYFLGTTAEAVVKKAPCPVLVVKKKPNFSYRKILIPIDFSPASKQTLQFVNENLPKANIELLHVEDVWYEKSLNHFPPIPREGALHKQMLELLNEKMFDFLKESKVDCSNMTTKIRGGYPARVIANEVKQKNIDLVIIGTRGQTNLQYILLGSVAERILQEVDTDIIAVPPSA